MLAARPSPSNIRASRCAHRPFAAGGPTDDRAWWRRNLSEARGQQVVTENIPGAGGNTGVAMAARAAPDGYTMLVVSTGFMVNPSMY
jgi:tripartite-type tricarboxylate transporter receptor subunit TctC